MSNEPISAGRRRLLQGAGAAAALPLLAACGNDDDADEGAPLEPGPTGSDESSIPEPNGSIVTRWASDPFALGSYSFLAVGATPQHRVALAAPVGQRLTFAGEATSSDYPATVHGAVYSGLQAASDLADVGPGTVVVIGAGAAGIAAATALQEEGADVIVLEARNRIGGRVNTDRSLGLPLDLGASWIHGVTDNVLTEIAEDLGVDVFDFDYDSHIVRDARGMRLDEDEVSDEFVEVSSVEHEYAADVAELAPEAFTEGGDLGGGDVLFPGGFDQLFTPAAEVLDVRLGQQVRSISYTDGDVTVVTETETFTVDAAVVTLPLGVLKAGAVTFVPPLPTEKQEAIDALGMGLLNKVYLEFDEPFWDEGAQLLGYDGPERGVFAEWVNLLPVVGEPILLGFNASSTARRFEGLSDAEIVAEAMTALRAMYG